MVSGKPSDSVCARNACSHLVPAMKQDIASTEYGVIPAAVRSSPGTKILTRAVSSGFARALIIFCMTTRAHTVPKPEASCQEKAADVFPEAGIQ